MEVHLGHLVANAQAIRSAALGTRLLAVVKADAYGLGASEVAAALGPLDPWGFAVATIDEGLRLRAAGLQTPILVLMPARRLMRKLYVKNQLHATIEDTALASSWPGPYHLEIDTGMGRTGIRWSEDRAIGYMAGPNLEGCFTHFHSADDHPETVAIQWGRFEKALHSLGTRPRLLHAANSASVWRLHRALDLIRPGIYLFGGQPAVGVPRPLPVVSVKARVLSLRSISRGETVSYGGDWAAAEETVVATVGIGYADGVPRLVKGRAQVLLGGSRYPVVGRVTMDMMMVSLGSHGRSMCRVGDVATILGAQGGEEITLDEFALWSDTSPYEVLTRLSPRLPRVFVK